MPASKHAFASSSNALAVIAMMGIVFASARASARIARVALTPSMLGIIISIKMPAYVPGTWLSNSSSAFRPSCAVSVVIP